MNSEVKEMDVVNMDEMALDGVSHLMTVKDWEGLLGKRLYDSNEGVKPLSADFIIKHKNDMRMGLLNLWFQIMVGMGVKGYDLDFMRRFWKYCQLDGMQDCTCIASRQFLGETKDYPKVEAIFKDKVLMLDTAKLLDLDTVEKQVAFLPTLQDYEKNPYYYDMAVLYSMLEFLPDIPDTFLEKFIHLVNFPCIFDNLNLSNDRKLQIIDKFGVRIGRTQRFLLPDGTVVKKTDMRDGLEPGNEYYDNVQRYKTEDEKAIRAIVQKFPRAVLDCYEGDNALVMQGKN